MVVDNSFGWKIAPFVVPIITPWLTKNGIFASVGCNRSTVAIISFHDNDDAVVVVVVVVVVTAVVTAVVAVVVAVVK